MGEHSEADFKMGLTFIACTVGFLTLFYLVNHHDKDMRKFTYASVSTTVSIFIAVLSYTQLEAFIDWVIDKVVDLFSEDDDADTKSKLAVFLVKVLFSLLAYWTFVVTLSCPCGRLPKKELKKEATWSDKRNVLRVVRNNLKATVVFAHIAGFSFIGAWGFCQTEKKWIFHSHSLYAALESILVFGACWLLLALAYPVTKTYVSKMLPEQPLPENDNDNEQRALTPYVALELKQMDMANFEKHKKLYADILKDGENDMIALVVSFLFVNSLRFMVGGHLPNAIGEEEDEALLEHGWPEIGWLYFCSFLFIQGLFAKYYCLQPADKKHKEDDELRFVIESSSESEAEESEEEEGQNSYCYDVYKQFVDKDRLLEIGENILLMGFAWSFYYASQWMVVRIMKNNKHLINGEKSVDGTLLDLVVAMMVSVLAGIGVFALDSYADRLKTSDDPNKSLDESAVRSVIRGIALLVGFAWEQSFDVTVGVVGEHAGGKVGKLIVMVGLIAVIVPAWIMYIVPMREEHGYRFGFVARKTSARAKESFLDEEEYKGETKRANEYAMMLSALAEALPEDLLEEMESKQVPIVRRHERFFAALKHQSMIQSERRTKHRTSQRTTQQ